MKEELIEILEKLEKSNSWDLAPDLIKGLKNIKVVKNTYLKSINDFIKIALLLTKNSKKQKNLLYAIEKIKNIKILEEYETKNEKNNLIEILDNIN